MDKIKFGATINSYLELIRSYKNIEIALYGHEIREGQTEDNFNMIEEYLLEQYIGLPFLSDYVFDDVMDYMCQCEKGQKFTCDNLMKIVHQALDTEASDAIK